MSLTLLQSRPIPNATQVAKFLFFALIQKNSNFFPMVRGSSTNLSNS